MAVELDVGHPILLPPGGGEVVRDSEERRVEILCDCDELHATWSRFGARRDGASPHVHRHHSDLFYVLQGELTFLVGPERIETVLPVGTLVLAPPLVVHGFRNGSDAEVHFLNFHAPGGCFADYLRGEEHGLLDAEDPPADGGRPAEDALVARVEPGSNGVVVLVDENAIRVAEVRGTSAAESTSDRLTCFYVLEGESTIATEGRELRAVAGAWVQIPPGLEHSLTAAGARVLELRT